MRQNKLNIFILACLTLIFFTGTQVFADPPNGLPPGLLRAADIQEAHTPDLMADPGVVGTAVGLDSTGNAVIQVFLTEEGIGGIPGNLGGVRVVKKVTGKLVSYKGKPSGPGKPPKDEEPPEDPPPPPDDPTTKQDSPIKLGTSGGWRYDIANGYCCGGTLGSLIEIGANQYVLSNYHVLYADIVYGGNQDFDGNTITLNPKIAGPGDPVIQPGLIDVGCIANNAQEVATLVWAGGSLPGANVDAGIAQVITGMVDPNGAILNIGQISSQTIAASIGQAVKKMGRTTGLSSGTVSGLNATVNITYDEECAGGTAFTKTFTGQIVITNNRCRFLDGGDSGSLMVEDVDIDPQAVGLLYAGSGMCNKRSIAVANPIDEVLNYYGASMVGN